MNDRDPRLPPGWWLLPAAIVSALMWAAFFNALAGHF
ncbi:hypothetical protein U703_02290 [Rhodobacter capsulatus YW1]|nr:hypothetical protein U703_02290 [Rhodobacter capsulatus YW1]